MPETMIRVPTLLRSGAGPEGTVRAEGPDVGSALRDWAGRDPRAASFLFTPEGRPRRGYAVFLNGRDIRNLEGESTPLLKGDVLAIVAAVPGG